MVTPNINTTKTVVPMIYAYTTPEIARHNGFTKIGYTEQKVETRINQQTHTSDVNWNLEWKGNAVFEDGSGKVFKDTAFHAYLKKEGIKREDGTEWFRITGEESKSKFYEFKENRGITGGLPTVIQYKLRDEQEKAVEKTLEYRKNHEYGEFLWNAKPRFGKTLSVYDFCKKAGAKKILIVTNRPAIANSWREDYANFLGVESGYVFVSEVETIKGKAGVLSRAEYLDLAVADNREIGCIEFVSLQDLKGSKYFSSNNIDKLKEVADLDWDLLVIDEAHEGVDTYRTDVAFDRIKRHFTLHLSGTPFKALANSKFADDAIFNWTYADEQASKRNWDVCSEEENPYEDLPRLNMFTYQMSEIIKGELRKGIELDGKTEEYAFDLNEFFSANNKKFKYGASVDKFLDALTLQKKFPFSTPELRNELKHSFWLLNRVDSAKAMAEKLKNHPVFKDYHVILAAGDGKIDDEDETKKSYDKVVDAIKKYDKTITLSVGQLTTGITVPEWTAVLMLSNVKSPALYMQAAFRAQNPCLFRFGNENHRKVNAYVFDFDPARTLTVFEEFANDLCADTAAGKGDSEKRKERIKELLNFFPVIGEDENGELVELDAEKVLTVPRKLKSAEVVRRGFMSNFLFQNISQVFGAPKEIMEIISSFKAADDTSPKINIPSNSKEHFYLNENDEIDIPNEIVIGKAEEIFGDKIFAPTEDFKAELLKAAESPHLKTSDLKSIKETANSLSESILSVAKETYGSNLQKREARLLETKIAASAKNMIDKSFANFEIDKNEINKKREDALRSRHETGRSSEEIEEEFANKLSQTTEKFKADILAKFSDIEKTAQTDIVRAVETSTVEREKNTIENGIKDSLRGFARTIPSFLMAYGNEEVTLATFDKIIPNDVFKEVTGITLEQFRFLRDGGTFNDEETGETKKFDGNIFDPVVFDDSIKEFLKKKTELSDYFNESNTENIFDYIPPQKTNQIFTPKAVVENMVDLLEKENPGCFDNPDNTFADLYMKSGLYIAEIIKRLYRSEEMSRLYPDEHARLSHILEKQVYGLAPTEIIYKIATNFILGFDTERKIAHHHFRQADAFQYTKNGTLAEKIDEIFSN